MPNQGPPRLSFSIAPRLPQQLRDSRRPDKYYLEWTPWVSGARYSQMFRHPGNNLDTKRWSGIPHPNRDLKTQPRKKFQFDPNACVPGGGVYDEVDLWLWCRRTIERY